MFNNYTTVRTTVSRYHPSNMNPEVNPVNNKTQNCKPMLLNGCLLYLRIHYFHWNSCEDLKELSTKQSCLPLMEVNLFDCEGLRGHWLPILRSKTRIFWQFSCAKTIQGVGNCRHVLSPNSQIPNAWTHAIWFYTAIPTTESHR